MYDMTSSARQSTDDPVGSMPGTASAAYDHRSRVLSAFDHFASRVTRRAGRPGA